MGRSAPSLHQGERSPLMVAWEFGKHQIDLPLVGALFLKGVSCSSSSLQIEGINYWKDGALRPKLPTISSNFCVK